jgi:hypothetical protein
MRYVRGACVLSLVLASGCAAIAGLDHTYERDDDRDAEVDPEASAGSTAGGGAGGSGGAGGIGGAGGEPNLKATITTFYGLYMDCKLGPPGPANSLEGSFDASYDNTKGASPVLAKVLGAKLAMAYLGSSYEWSFTVTPESTIVPASEAPVVKHAVSGAGSGTGSGEPCDHCAGEWTLTATWDIDGQGTLTDVAGPQPVNCLQ